MKKFIVLFLALFIIVSFFAEDYQFLALGDIHYLAEDYYKKLPDIKEAQKKRQAKYNMWKNGKSEALLAQSAKVANGKMTFVVQLGDLSEGGTYRQDLQEKMLANGFAKVKKYFPATSLTAVKGNHDNYKKAAPPTLPWKNIILPLMSKELGEDVTSVNYARMIGKDLYIYYDGQTAEQEGITFVKKVLEEHKDARYIFFFTHLPLIPISATQMAWRANGSKKLISLLSERNAIVLTAHVHVQSYASMNTEQGKLTQFSVSSIGYNWGSNKAVKLRYTNVDDFLNNPHKVEFGKITLAEIMEEMKAYTFNEFSIYNIGSGFAIIKVGDDGVEINFYSNLSSEPTITKTLYSQN